MVDNQSQTPMSSRFRNIFIAVVAVGLSIALFLGLRTETSSFSLEAQAENSIALDTALGNGKPTMIEFYADWCTSCQTMAQDLGELKQEYGKKVNFVMLNVDNTKWLPEVLRYRVDGIPHFIFLGNDGQELAQAIGEQPRSVMTADLDALVANLPIPYTYPMGRISDFEAQLSASSSPDDPRSHGAQVNQ